MWTTALLNSIIVAVGATTLAVLMAWPIAYLLWSTGSKLSKTLAGLGALPFAVPPIVFGVGLGFFWSFTGGLGEIWAGVLSHAILLMALPLVTISIGLQSIDRSHLDAAATMGATEQVAFKTAIMPYTISGFFFVLVLSSNEFIVIFFASASSYATVTLQIFNSLRSGYTPTMAVAAITFLVVSVLVFSAVARWGDLPRLMGADQSRKHGAHTCPANPRSSANRSSWSSTSGKARSSTAPDAHNASLNAMEYLQEGAVLAADEIIAAMAGAKPAAA